MESGRRKSWVVFQWSILWAIGWWACASVACGLADLEEPTPGGGNQFGSGVAVRGDVVVVGALLGDVTGGDAGAVHVFRVEQGGISFVASLGLSDGESGDLFGAAVATDGTLIIGGAPGWVGGGRVGVFRRDEFTGVWEMDDFLHPPGNLPGVSRFGAATAVDGEWVAVGAPGDDGDVGAVDLFRYFDDAGQWGFVQRLGTGVAGDGFGVSVAMAGDWLVVGVPDDSTAGPNAGCAVVYELDQSSQMWVQNDVLKTASDPSFARLGASVAIDGERVIAGAPFAMNQGVPTGAAFVFARDEAGWGLDQKLVAIEADGFDFVGGGVAISGDLAIVGASLSGADDRGAAYVFRRNGGSGLWSVVQTSEGVAGARFGHAVAVDGAVAIVGGPLADGGVGSASGMVAAFAVADDVDGDGVFDLCDNCRWVSNADQSDADANGVGDYCESSMRACERQMTMASDTSALSRYGHSADASGSLAVVGARFGNGAVAASGSAYVLQFDGERWEEVQPVFASDGSIFDEFGSSVGMDDVVVVGAPLEDEIGPDGGAAYVFRFDEAADEWVQEQKLLPSDGADFDAFGHAVATFGDVIAVTAPNHNAVGEFSGAVYVFRFDDVVGQWMEEAKLVGSDTVAFDEFGQSVSVDENAMVVGAWRDDDAGVSSGSAYVFRNVLGEWVEERKLTAMEAASFQRFGVSVAIDGEVVVVGAHQSSVTLDDAGAAHVFQRDNVGEWVEVQRLEASTVNVLDRFGVAVAVDGTTIAVGSRFSDVAVEDGGAVYVYAYDGRRWDERSVVTASDVEPEEEFGRAVAVSGNWVLVGSRFDEPAGTESGSAYFYRIAGLDGDRDGVQNGCDNCEAAANGDQTDCDENDVGDACIQPGDIDGDGVASLVDFSTLTDCQAGDLIDVCGDVCLAGFDFDGDGDSDLLDFGVFQAVFDDTGG